MAEKNKLSKEMEEQIQGLASDVYIQIEEKLTQFIRTATAKETSEKKSIEQDPAYLALLNNYQASQKELSEKNKNFSNQIIQLEQSATSLKSQLSDEQNKYADIQAELKVISTDSENKLSQIEQENNQIKHQLSEEVAKQHANEQNFQVE